MIRRWMRVFALSWGFAAIVLGGYSVGYVTVFRESVVWRDPIWPVTLLETLISVPVAGWLLYEVYRSAQGK